MPDAASTDGDGPLQRPTSFLKLLESSISKCPRLHYEPFKKICIIGTDDSATAGTIISEYADEVSSTPIPVIRNLRVPEWVDKDTYVFLLSCTNPNKRACSIFKDLRKKECKIACISCESELLDLCVSNKVPVIQVPCNLPMHDSIAFVFGKLASIFQDIGLIDSKDAIEKIIPSLNEYWTKLSNNSEKWLGDVLSAIKGKNILVCNLSNMKASSEVWKMMLNDSTGELIFNTELPEFDHNEIVGWCNENEHSSDLLPILLYDDGVKLLNYIVETVIEVLEESNRKVQTVYIEGNNSIERNMYGILLSNYLSLNMSSVDN